MKSNRSKIIALSSAVVFALAIAALKFENTLGLLPILVAIVAFFTCVIHTSMHLSAVMPPTLRHMSLWRQSITGHTLYVVPQGSVS